MPFLARHKLAKFENDDRVSIAPFNAVEIELAALWAD
jgi:hypothetical protein